MGWFEEQIKQRIQQDDEQFSSAFVDMASIVMNKNIRFSKMNSNRKLTDNAIEEIMNYYHLSACKAPDEMEEIEDILEYELRSSGLMKRRVELQEGWYHDAFGAMLGVHESGDIVALLPNKFGGYHFRDPKDGSIIKIKKQNQHLIQDEAYCFYQPFPKQVM